MPPRMTTGSAHGSDVLGPAVATTVFSAGSAGAITATIEGLIVSMRGKVGSMTGEGV